MDFQWFRLETDQVRCWSDSERTERKSGEEDNDLSKVTVRHCPHDPPSRHLLEQNAVIFADTNEILERALGWMPAVPTGQRPDDPREGMGLHILQSEMFGMTADDGFGRVDFWNQDPEPTVKPPRQPRAQGEPPPPAQTPHEMAQEVLGLAETAREMLGNTSLNAGALLGELVSASARLSQKLAPEDAGEPEDSEPLPF